MKKTEIKQNIDLYILEDYLFGAQREIRTEDYYMILFNRNNEMKIIYENQTLPLATGNILFVTPDTRFQIEKQTMEKAQSPTLLIRFHWDFWDELIASSPDFNYIYDMHEGESLFVLRTPPPPGRVFILPYRCFALNISKAASAARWGSRAHSSQPWFI